MYWDKQQLKNSFFTKLQTYLFWEFGENSQVNPWPVNFKAFFSNKDKDRVRDIFYEVLHDFQGGYFTEYL